MKKKYVTIFLSLGLLVACQNKVDSNDSKPLDYSELLNNEITGDLAYSTTAFVEKYWRVVGNSGFDSSIYEVVRQLEENGYVLEEASTSKDRMTYRIEKRELKTPTWEPVGGEILINGEGQPLLQYATNRNMIAINSYSTPIDGVKAEVIYVQDPADLANMDVKGKIVFAEIHPRRIYKPAVTAGAIGIVTYSNPDYLQPEKNTSSIQFREIPMDDEVKAWGIALSFEAKERLKNKLKEGVVTLTVKLETKIYQSEELTVVAEIRGSEFPEQRLVF